MTGTSDNLMISIITIVYNDSLNIESTLLSYFNQKYKNTQLIVIDGGSTDGTLDILEKYTEQIAYLVSEPDSGIYNAMNKGLKHAEGSYVYFLNSGDSFVDDDVLLKVSKEIKSNPVEVICGKVYLTSAIQHNDVMGSLPKYKVPHPAFRQLFNSGFCHQALFVSKDAYLNVGGFDERFKTFADFVAVSQIIKKTKVIYYIDVAVAFFDNNGVSSNWRHVKKLELEKKEIFKILGEEQNVFFEFLRKIKTNLFIVRKKIAYACFNR